MTPAGGRRALLLAPLALAACVSLPSLPELGTATTYTGRFAVTAKADVRSDSAAGRFTLITSATSLTLDLSTPLGTTLARLERSPGGVRLTAPRDDGSLGTVQGGDPDELMRSAFGWSIPVDGLGDWITGRAVPQVPATVRTDAQGRVTSIEQGGWTIDIQERFDANGSPRRLQAARPAVAGAPALTLRLVLDDPGPTAQ